MATQKIIASILSTYDKLIENNRRRIALLESMAEEIYKEWFVRLRFPGYENSRFLDKEGNEVPHGTEGALPEGWERVRLSTFGKIITGKTPSKAYSENFDGPIPFIKTPDMYQGVFITSSEETLSMKGAESQKSQYIPKNAISVSCIGTVGEVCISTQLSQTNQQINTIIPSEIFFREFLFLLLRRLKPQLASYAASGATMANLSKGKLEKMMVLMPRIDIIEKYSGSFSSVFDNINLLQEKNQLLQETRDLLLPRLISGKLSVEHLLKEDHSTEILPPKSS